MPQELRHKLQRLIDRPTGLVEFIGLSTLGVISLALPDIKQLLRPDFWKQFTTVGDIQIYFEPKLAPLALIGVTIFWYYQFKAAATGELGLIDHLFDEDHAPLRLQNIYGHKLLPYMGYLIVSVFCVLILLTPHIAFYCLAAFVLHGNDLMGQAIMSRNLNKILIDFPLSPESQKAKFVQKRREVLLRYFYDNPTFPRIACIFIVTATSFVIAVEFAPKSPALYLASYALMIVNILMGELIMKIWRRKRDNELESIDAEEENERRHRPGKDDDSS